MVRHCRPIADNLLRMFKGVLLLLGLVAASLGLYAWAASSEEAPLRWHRWPDMPTGVFNAAMSLRGSQAIITGGINQAGVASDVVQVLDLERREWVTPLQLPEGRFFHTQTSLADGRVLIAGGQTGQVPRGMVNLRSAWVIDLAAGVTAIPDLPHDAVGATSHLLADGSVAVVGGPNVSIFDPATMQWSRFIKLRRSRQDHASVLLPDGRLFIVGGVGADTMEIADFAAGASQMLAVKLPMPLDDLQAVLIDKHRVWVLGGQNSRTGDTVDQTWIVDLSDSARATIEAGPSLGIADGVADHRVAVLGPWVFVIGGESQRAGKDTELNTVRILDTRDLKVWSLPPTQSPHDDALALVWRDSVVVIGGFYENRQFLGSLTVPVASRVVESLRLPSHRSLEAVATEASQHPQ